MRFFPPLLKARGGERPSREGGTWVDRPLLDPLLQLSPEQSGQEEFKLQLLPGEITSAIRKSPTSAQGTQNGSCSVVQQQLTEAGERRPARESGKERGCWFVPTHFLMLLFLASLKKKKKKRFSLSALHSSIQMPSLNLWNSAYCAFVLITGFGTLIRQMTDTGQIETVVRSYVGSSHYHSQDTFSQKGTPSWLVMLLGQK